MRSRSTASPAARRALARPRLWNRRSRRARGGYRAAVTGIDLAPALIETARGRAREQGLEIDYRVGDCERLELEDAAFDVLSSTFEIMFAPDHEASAGELARVVRPGGRIGLANWTPEGAIGTMFEMMAPFAPPPAPGAGSPFDWGSEEHVRLAHTRSYLFVLGTRR